jgi:hypothetical protein
MDDGEVAVEEDYLAEGEALDAYDGADDKRERLESGGFDDNLLREAATEEDEEDEDAALFAPPADAVPPEDLPDEDSLFAAPLPFDDTPPEAPWPTDDLPPMDDGVNHGVPGANHDVTGANHDVTDVSPDVSDGRDGEEVTEEVIYVEDTGRGRLWVLGIFCGLCALVSVGAVLYLTLFAPKKIRESIPEPPPQIIERTVERVEIIREPAPPPPPVESPPAPPPAARVPSSQRPAAGTREPERYTVKWGDTLWDLAGNYYDNPWRYRAIAQYNGITDPAHIVSGTEILIPPR